MTKLKATVLFDYDAEASDELTLRVGDVLTNIKHVEEGWCQGVLNGKTGMFPDNFVKVEEEKTPQKATPAPAPAPAKPSKTADSKRYMKVIFAYEPANADELKLVVDNIIEVIKDEEEGWAFGSVNGQKGAFPTNFCTPITMPAEENKEADPKTETKQPSTKKMHGVGFGDIFGGGPIKLKNKQVGAESSSATDKAPTKTNDEKSSEKVAKDKVEKPAQKPVNKKSKATSSERYRATFDYQATTSDELTIAIGDIITIITKDTGDDGWWEGELVKDGKKQRGLFPDNFVALISADEAAQKSPSTKEPPPNVPEEKPKAPEPEKSITKESESQVTVKKSNSSSKKTAPEVPAASTKPKADESAAAADLNTVVEAASSADQLVHIRRPSGPKNRRKPDSAGRRERAKEALEEAEAAAAVVDTVPETPEPEPTPVPQITPKKEPNRGIQVMPSLNPSADSGAKPAWMKNLKSRNSQKKDTVPPPTIKTEEASKEKPDWLSNLRKRPKSGEKMPSPAVPNKPAPAVTSPKPSQANKQAIIPPASHPATTLAASDNTIRERPTSFKRTQFKENGTAAVDGEATEIKKLPIRPPAPAQSSGDLPKKPLATKPKPPPSKTKPALPGAKPVTSSSIDELKEEISSLRELLSNLQSESKKEINRLSNELEEEKIQRINLQNEVADLLKRIG